MEADRKIVILGRISGLFGVRGWVKVHSFTEPREGILDYSDWLLMQGEEWQPIRIEEGRRQGKTVVVKLEDVNDRDQAAALIDAAVAVSRQVLPAAAEGEFYWSDLEGLQVVDRQGQILGTVSHLLETGANDVLVVLGDQEILIPFVMDKVILGVDLSQGVIKVDWEWS